jgi:hypothetical protein
MDYNEFIEWWQRVIKEAVYDQGQKLIAYAEELERMSHARYGRTPMEQAVAQMAARVNELWRNRTDW